jgi:hypothetical protein
MSQEDFTLRRQRDLAPLPVEKNQVKLLFQLANRHTDSRLSNAQGFGGTRKIPCICHFYKGF